MFMFMRRPDPVEKISRLKLCFARLECFDWAFDIFQPIRVLETNVE